MTTHLDKGTPIQVLKVTKKEVTPYYSSKWEIIMELPNEDMISINIIRFDDETHINMESILERCHTLGEVMALDKKSIVNCD